jgi:hypothetical protein
MPPNVPRVEALYEALNDWVLPSARWSRVAAEERDAPAFIQARRYSWYYDRLAEVPDDLVKRWAADLRKRSPVSLEDSAALALSLRDAQLQQFAEMLSDEGVYLGEPLHFADMLRVYGSLAPTQRQALLAGKQLAIAAVPADARRWLRVHEERFQCFGSPEKPAQDHSRDVLTLSVSSVERVVTQMEDGTLRAEYHLRDGPNAGKPVNGGFRTFSPAQAPPGGAEGGQVSQQADFVFRSGGYDLHTQVILPYVYATTKPPEKAAR